MANVKVRFIDDPSDSKDGQIEVTTTSAADPAANHKVGITGPDGVVVKEFPISADGTGLLIIQEFDIPVTADGSYIYGEYIIAVSISDSSSFFENITYKWCPDANKTLAVSVIDDCFAKSIVVKDNTVYPTSSGDVTVTATREITVDHPIILDTDDVVDTVSSDQEVIIPLTRSNGISYYNVTYGVRATGSIEVSDASTANWDVGYIKAWDTYQTEILVQCGADVCSIISCIDTKMQELIEKGCKAGGLHNLQKQDADLLVLIQSNISMYTYWLECKNSSKVAYYYNQLKTLVGTDCLTVTGPQAIPDSSITYLRGRSAYEVWVDAGNTGTVDDFLNSLYPVGDWIEVSGYSSGYSAPSSEAMRYRIIRTHLEFLGKFDTAALQASGFELLPSSFNPVETEAEAGVPIYNRTDGGVVVGQLYRVSSSGAWQVRYGSGYDIADDQFVYGMVPISGVISSTPQSVSTNYPAFSGWVDIPDGQYLNGFTSNAGDRLQYRQDGRLLVFKGKFDAVGEASTGFQVIDPAFWTAQGITFSEQSYAPVYEVAANADQASPVGYIGATSAIGTIIMYGSSVVGTDEGDELRIAGPLIID